MKRIRFTDKEVDRLREHFWNAALTYPRHILKRRLGLLTLTEKRKVKRGLEELERRLSNALDDFYNDNMEFVDEKIEGIIANRAEIKRDPWK